MKHTANIIFVLCVIGFLVIYSSTSSKAPTLTYYASHLGITLETLGLIAAASTITGIVINFLSGYLSDIYGRKKLLLISGFVFVSAPLLYFLANNALSLILVRCYYGFATAIFMPVSLAYIADIYIDKRGTAMGLFLTSTLIGRFLAPITAGLMIFIWGFHPVFIFCSVLGLIALVIMTSVPSSPRKRAIRSGHIITLTGYGTIKAGVGIILVLGLMEALLYFGLQSIETFLPIYLPEFKVLEWIPGLILSLQILTIAIFESTGGYLSDKIGSYNVISVGLVLSTISMLLLSLSENIFEILLYAILFAIGLALSIAGSKPLASELLGARYRGASLGAVESLKDIGQAIGPIFTGYMAIANNLSIAFLYNSVILLIPLLLLIIMKFKYPPF